MKINNIIRNTIAIALILICSNCSDSRSRAKISFSKAIAPANTLGTETKLKRFGCDDIVLEVLDGKEPIISPDISYSILYENPPMIASIQCTQSAKAGKAAYNDAIKKLANHPLQLSPRDNLNMTVPATGYWKDDERDQKQVIFCYGNLVVVVQNFFGSDRISVNDVKNFAKDYVKYLDTVSGVK